MILWPGDGADAVRHRDGEQVEGGGNAHAQKARAGHQRARLGAQPRQSRKCWAPEERPLIPGTSGYCWAPDECPLVPAIAELQKSVRLYQVHLAIAELQKSVRLYQVHLAIAELQKSVHLYQVQSWPLLSSRRASAVPETELAIAELQKSVRLYQAQSLWERALSDANLANVELQKSTQCRYTVCGEPAFDQANLDNSYPKKSAQAPCTGAQ